MIDIVLFPAHHWHLVWVTSHPPNCLSFLAAGALYSLVFSVILIIIYSLILRPRLLLCFQVMYSFTEWFIGEERGKREGKALRWRISKFHDFWVSETVPKFLVVLEAFHCMMKALSFCVVCFILQYFMILIYSELCWFVTSFSSLPQEEISLETQARSNALKWDTANEQLPSDDGFCYLPHPCRILQHLITSKNDKGKTKPTLLPLLSLPIYLLQAVAQWGRATAFSSQGRRFCDSRGNHECKTCQLNSILQHIFSGKKKTCLLQSIWCPLISSETNRNYIFKSC